MLITLGGTKTQTKTVANSQSPVWDFVARLGVDSPAAADTLLLQVMISRYTVSIISTISIIQVYDDDIGKDDALGSVSIPVTEIYQGASFSRRWYPLEKCKETVHWIYGHQGFSINVFIL